jgi:hypothetical protein
MTLDKRETGVMDLINAYAKGLITDQECTVMGDLLLNEITTIAGEDNFNVVFPNSIPTPPNFHLTRMKESQRQMRKNLV